MFCNKCGKELPDNAIFCSGCGNQVNIASTGTPGAQASSLPPILSRLISQVTNFFTKKDPVGVVVNSAKDTSFSGAVFAVVAMLIIALSNMVNVNQLIVNLVKKITMGLPIDQKMIAKLFPSGASFGLTLLSIAVIYVVAVAMVYVAVKFLHKKEISLSGACNVVSYSAIPMVGVAVINMLAGLIWFVLPPVFTILGGLFTVVLIVTAVNKYSEATNTLISTYATVAAIVLVTLLFTYITTDGVIDALISKAGGEILGAFGDIGSLLG